MFSLARSQSSKVATRALTAALNVTPSFTANSSSSSSSATPQRSIFVSSSLLSKEVKPKAAEEAATNSTSAGYGSLPWDTDGTLPKIYFPRAPKKKEIDPRNPSNDVLSDDEKRFGSRAMPPLEARAKYMPSTYTTKSKMRDHVASDVGKYYSVTDDLLAQVPGAISRTMQKEYMGGGKYQMIRVPEVRLNKRLTAIQDAKRPSNAVFGVRGYTGCGKSAYLNYAAHFARQNGWLIIATRGEEFPFEKRGMITASATRTDIFDQALYTMDFFKRLAESEGDNLKKIQLKTEVKNHASLNGKSTLYDLAIAISESRELAPELLAPFIAEVKQADEVPIMILIDNMNVWDSQSAFIKPLTYEPIQARELALVDAFSTFQTSAPKRGVSIWSITTRYASLKKVLDHFSHPSVEPVDVTYYSMDELRHSLLHYQVSNFLIDAVETPVISRIQGLTGNVPRDVFLQAWIR